MATTNSGPRVLILDIETAPALAEVWQLFDVQIGLSQIRRDPYLLCFAAKWYGNRSVDFYSSFDLDRETVAMHARDLLDEADIVVTFNGKRFDIPHLHREILLAKFTPPSPFKQVDLYQASKSQFKWLSNKLDYVAGQLGVGTKVKHPGHELWTRCIDGDRRAWALMRKYNIQDVVLTEQVYDVLQAWIPNHPHYGLWADSGAPCCPRCGGTDLQRRGTAKTTTQSYQRFQCQGCGGWLRGTDISARVKGTRLL